jgi:hypothetical protein
MIAKAITAADKHWTMLGLILATAVLTYLICFAVSTAPQINHSHVMAEALGTIPMQTPSHVTYQTPNQWSEELTQDVKTSAHYATQQSAMRTVLIDVHGQDPICRESSQWHGLAVPSARLICVKPDLWKNDAYAYYILAHELAHIALSEYGRTLGNDAHAHRPEHFQLTIVIVDRLMAAEDIPQWKRTLVRWDIKATQQQCNKMDHC